MIGCDLFEEGGVVGEGPEGVVEVGAAEEVVVGVRVFDEMA